MGIALMLLLTNDLGNLGVAIARLTAFATIFFSIFFVEKKFFGAVQTKFWLSLAGNLSVAAATAALVELIVAAVLPINLPAFLLAILLGGAAYCIMLWLLGFVAEDDKQLIQGILKRAEIGA
jgi:hypothetical protein